MKDSRHKHNPSLLNGQNADLYEVRTFNTKKADVVAGDYYLKSHRPIGTSLKYKEGCENAGFHLQTTHFPTGNQHCITIKDESIRDVFLHIEWEKHFVTNIGWNYIGKPEVHNAFNSKRKEMKK